MPRERQFLGLHVGDALDGVDCALAVIAGKGPRMKVRPAAHLHLPLPIPLAQRLAAAQADLLAAGPTSDALWPMLDAALGQFLGQAAKELLRQARLEPGALSAIGMSGFALAFGRDPQRGQIEAVVELGSPATVARLAQAPVAAEFRRSLPAPNESSARATWPDWMLFSHRRLSRVLIGLGAVATLTFVPADSIASDTATYDIGPGTALLDGLARRLFRQPMDADGALAARGKPQPALLHELLTDPYFHARPPKSTWAAQWQGPYLDRFMLMAHKHHDDAQPHNIMATASELTARIVAAAVGGLTERPHEVILTGGGAMNIHLAARIRAMLSPSSTISSEKYHLPVRAKQALCHALLAAARLDETPIPVPLVTACQPSGHGTPAVPGGDAVASTAKAAAVAGQSAGQWKEVILGGMYMP